MDRKTGPRATPEAVEEARAELERVKERWRYVPDSPEAQAEIQGAEEALRHLEAEVVSERRRLAATRAAVAKAKARKEAEAERKRQEAREELPTLARAVEGAARSYWLALADWVREAVTGLEAVEERADVLDSLRTSLRAKAKEAGELGDRPGGSAAVRKLLQQVRKDAERAPEVPEARRITWAVEQLQTVGRLAGYELNMPMGGPSLPERQAREADAREDQEARGRARDRQRQEAQARKDRERQRFRERFDTLYPDNLRAVCKRLGIRGAPTEWAKAEATRITREQIQGGHDQAGGA